LKRPLTEGGLLPLTLTFEKEGTITVEAAIEAVGAQNTK
jgi:copper(I)-binding protein